MPISKSAGSHVGAPSSNTLFGPPERMMPAGGFATSSAAVVSQRMISEYTSCSRMRRAMSCVYCEP